MRNFTFHNPTRIIFGKGGVARLGPEAAAAGKKALFVYGGGSIKKNGVYGAASASLAENGITVTEHPGVKPNPVLDHVRAGVEKAKINKCEMVIAAGGGSVIDEAKAIAAGAAYNGDVWDFFTGKAGIKDALPIFTVLTLPATGSEMNSGCVITNEASKQKFSAGSSRLFPRVSILDPETTMTLPEKQTAYGAVDALSHLTEGYFSAADTDVIVTDELVQALARSVIASTGRILKDPGDYNARASMMWSATLSLNGLQSVGYGGVSFTGHAIEHSLSALYDIAHGAGLAIVLPALFKRQLEKTGPGRLEKFGGAVFGTKTAGETIEAFERLFKKIGAPIRLQEAGIPASAIPKIAENAMGLIKLWGINYDRKTVEEILTKAV